MTLSAGAARLLLVPILLGYGYIAVGYARATPRWNNPDEPAHVNVIRQIARTGTLPVLVNADWNKPLLDRLTTAWFPNDYEVDGIRYEGHQPPLYYLLAAPAHRMTADLPLQRQILALRLVSIAIGAVTVLAAYVVARECAPSRPVLAVLTAATVAFVPMHSAISAAVNNDALANALAAVTLAVLAAGLRRGFSGRWAVGLGILVGALVLTKLTVYVYVVLILAILLVAGRARARAGGAHWATALRWPIVAAGVGLLVCGPWLLRNTLVYGVFDPLAMARHDEVVVGQPRWAGYDLESLDFFFRILFRSFWGMFGWMGVVLDDGFYLLYLVLCGLAILGVAVAEARRFRPHPPAPPPACGRGGEVAGGRGIHRKADGGSDAVRLRHRGLLWAAALLVFGEVAYYNLTFIQPQGRYLFPALVPIALGLAAGWRSLADGAPARPMARLLTAGLLAGAVAWGLGEAHGALRASALWSDDALIGAAAVGVGLVLLAPRGLRRLMPDGLLLGLALTLALVDYAALVRFVGPAFPLR